MNLLDRFASAYPFPLDDFQVRAIRALSAGKSTLVCAPTGAGKTVVGEFALWLALERGMKAFYTTPIKALSNQKFGDFIAAHGAARVGLLTGDNSINSEAPVVVMTTEVLRNMIYERSPTLDGLGVVVLDEVHYLKDPYRGAVWEEVLIHLPPEVQVVALSATVSNAEEFGEWLRTVRGETEVVIETHRPVPLEHRLLVGKELVPLFERNSSKPNPALRRLGVRPAHGPGARRGARPGARPPGRRFDRIDRPALVEVLRSREMLPAISFIFSRAGCDRAVSECVSAGMRLTDAAERERIREYASLRAGVLPDEDLAALGYERWLDGLERGIAAHHAGLIPLFKETVEELFERALVKMVFATETLALGINMPAKTVVIERPVKFTGERHEFLDPADYTQLTGRAGRRGIDEVGYGVMPHQRDLPLQRVAELASARQYPLSSSFRPSFNMAVNLLRRCTVDEAVRLLNTSFGQFLADRGVVRLEREVTRNERYIAAYRERATCDRGDFGEYFALATSLRAADSEEESTGRRERGERVRRALASLRPGQVLALRDGPRTRLAVVLEVRRARDGSSQPVILDDRRRVGRLGARDFTEPPGVVGEVALPKGDPRAPGFRHEVARLLEALEPSAERPIIAAPRRGRALAERRAALAAHPCHVCPDRDDHERWTERLAELERETERLRRRVRARTETLGRVFARVLEVLESFGYVHEGALASKGERLCRIYNEGDLLVAEALERGVLSGLDAPELAAVVSTLVYQSRAATRAVPEFPTERVRRACARLGRIYAELRGAEDSHGLDLTREPDPGFVEHAYLWAAGRPLEEILDGADLSAGDFVRCTKQVWDLLQQLAEVAGDEPLRARCREAEKAVYRGVIAYSSAI